MDGLKKNIIPLLNKLPYVRTLHKLLKQYEEVTAYPPGHYYSPVPDVVELKKGKERLFDKKKSEAISVLKEKLALKTCFLRTFLMYNPIFEIIYFNNYIYEKHTDLLEEKMPECMRDEGASLYIRKIQ
jgi:hypothetical protein